MEHLNSELGHIPDVNLQELETSISELESRLSSMESGDRPVDHASTRSVEALIRNRKNLMEMLKRERFI